MKCSFDQDAIFIGESRRLAPDLSLTDADFTEILKFISSNWTLESFERDKQHKEGPFPFALPCEDELIFYPGSFSPWHQGHGACIRNAPADLPLVVIPDYNPWKEVMEREVWEEVSLIWKDLNKVRKKSPERKLSLFLGFLALGKKNPTVEWMSSFKLHYPQKKVWLLMGEDAFLGLHNWHQAENLLGLLEGLFICPRGERRELTKKQEELITRMVREPIGIRYLDGHRYEHLSSTSLRNS